MADVDKGIGAAEKAPASSLARHRGDFLELKRYILVETESYVAKCLHLLGFYPHFGCISRRALVMHPAQPSKVRLDGVHFIFCHIHICTRLPALCFKAIDIFF